jgi:hypothetical protein
VSDVVASTATVDARIGALRVAARCKLDRALAVGDGLALPLAGVVADLPAQRGGRTPSEEKLAHLLARFPLPSPRPAAP